MRFRQRFGRWKYADAINYSVVFSVIPMVEVFPLEQAVLAFENMMTSKVHFRSVLKMGN
jgi:D-arabinose 1-dehydrogenase-like Zn-dependent alcohol dehydrogenase